MRPEEKDVVLEYGVNDGVTKATVDGFVGRDGYFWGKNEHMARWSSCTHLRCSCGSLMTKGWTKCESCRDQAKIERFKKLEVVDWDGVTPICTFDDDTYFFDEDSLAEYCDEHDVAPQDLMLVLCKPSKRRVLSAADFLEDDIHEDWEPTKEIEDAVKAFNEAVAKDPYQTWFSTNTAVRVSLKI